MLVTGGGQMAKLVSERHQVEAAESPIRGGLLSHKNPSWMKNNNKNIGQGVKTARFTAQLCCKPAV